VFQNYFEALCLYLQQMQIMLKCSEHFGLCESQQLYRFIGNNPVNYIDLTGHVRVSSWLKKLFKGILKAKNDKDAKQDADDWME